MVEVVWHKISTGGTLQIVSSYFEMTARDLLPTAGKLENDQLLNTLDEVLKLLEEIDKTGHNYGMLTAETICFCNGDIRLNLGPYLEKQLG